MGVNSRGAKGAAAPLVHLRGGSAPLVFLPCLQIMFYVFFYLRMSFRKSIAISNDDVIKHDNISTKVTVADTGGAAGLRPPPLLGQGSHEIFITDIHFFPRNVLIMPEK